LQKAFKSPWGDKGEDGERGRRGRRRGEGVVDSSELIQQFPAGSGKDNPGLTEYYKIQTFQISSEQNRGKTHEKEEKVEQQNGEL
jgi:hypothetical protein